jgi:hypothetical protein
MRRPSISQASRSSSVLNDFPPACAGGAPRRAGERQYEQSVLGPFFSGGVAREDLRGLSQGGRCLVAECFAVA